MSCRTASHSSCVDLPWSFFVAFCAISRIRRLNFFCEKNLELPDRFFTERATPLVVLQALVGFIPLVHHILPNLQTSFDLSA
jgi:hypothetical protein